MTARALAVVVRRQDRIASRDAALAARGIPDTDPRRAKLAEDWLTLELSTF